MKMLLRLCVVLVLVTLPMVASAQEAAEADNSPATGLAFTGRLNMVNTAGLDGVGGFGAPAPVTIGTDQGGWTLGVGPAFHRFSNKLDDFDATSVGMVGINVLTTFTVSEAAEGRLRLYPLIGLGSAVGFTSEDVQARESIYLQGQLGFGARYFVTPHLAAHIEVGEGLNYLSVTDTLDSTSKSTLLTTWGDLGMSIVF